jgi:hypothetical protein
MRVVSVIPLTWLVSTSAVTAPRCGSVRVRRCSVRIGTR